MGRMTVRADVPVYEKNGDDKGDKKPVGVLAHWNRRDFVVLKIGAQEFTVAADDLIRAVQAAQKAHS